MDNSEWRKHQKSSWPTGSLHRALIRDFPGCKSLSDALNKTILNNSPSTERPQEKGTINDSSVKTKEPNELEKYRALQEAIKSVANYEHLGFNTWQVPEHIRARLNAMPLNSIEETILWRDHWKAWIKKIKEQSGDSKSGED